MTKRVRVRDVDRAGRRWLDNLGDSDDEPEAVSLPEPVEGCACGPKGVPPCLTHWNGLNDRQRQAVAHSIGLQVQPRWRS
jgi:hypothetical protein